MCRCVGGWISKAKPWVLSLNALIPVFRKTTSLEIDSKLLHVDGNIIYSKKILACQHTHSIFSLSHGASKGAQGLFCLVFDGKTTRLLWEHIHTILDHLCISWMLHFQFSSLEAIVHNCATVCNFLPFTIALPYFWWHYRKHILKKDWSNTAEAHFPTSSSKNAASFACHNATWWHPLIRPSLLDKCTIFSPTSLVYNTRYLSNIFTLHVQEDIPRWHDLGYFLGLGKAPLEPHDSMCTGHRVVAQIVGVPFLKKARSWICSTELLSPSSVDMLMMP